MIPRKKFVVLDLFSGLGGWTAPISREEAEIYTLDIEKRFSPTWEIDVRDWWPPEWLVPDVTYASPPCETFSLMQVGRNWRVEGDRLVPKSRNAAIAMTILTSMLLIIRELEFRNPAMLWFVENPRAAMRTIISPELGKPQTVWYCHYGEKVAKPTDIWTNSNWQARPECHNASPKHPDDCCCRDHIHAPRGSHVGTQGVGRGKDPAARALIPYGLAADIWDYVRSQLTHAS